MAREAKCPLEADIARTFKWKLWRLKSHRAQYIQHRLFQHISCCHGCKLLQVCLPLAVSPFRRARCVLPHAGCAGAWPHLASTARAPWSRSARPSPSPHRRPQARYSPWSPTPWLRCERAQQPWSALRVRWELLPARGLLGLSLLRHCGSSARRWGAQASAAICWPHGHVTALACALAALWGGTARENGCRRPHSACSALLGTARSPWPPHRRC